MANRELENDTYNIKPEIVNYIKSKLIIYPTGNGVSRAKHIINNGGRLTGFELKRLKNFFDNFNPQITNAAEYELAGGNLMKAEVDTILNATRSGNDNSKKVRQDMNFDPNSELHTYQTPRLNEADKKKKKDELKKNAVAVIVNNDNKILLLKRGKEAPWMPGKWSLVGGAVEKDETPQQAVEREILEEIGLEINKFVKVFSIQRNPDSIETVFACRFEGDPAEIELDNSENTNYGWYDVDEMHFLDIVPNLIEYIILSFTGKKYED